MVGAEIGSRSITAVYSNIGIVRFPEEYQKFIERFGIFASTDSLHVFLFLWRCDDAWLHFEDPG